MIRKSLEKLLRNEPDVMQLLGMREVLGLILCLLVVSCQHVHRDVQALPVSSPTHQPSGYGPPRTITTIKNHSVNESSGLVASRTSPGIYWTHNDSGDGPFLYAFDLSGRSMGVWRVPGATNVDWEDIAAGPGPVHGKPYLYIGDIGDNDSLREDIVVYRITEPVVSDSARASSKAKPRATDIAETFHFRYPDGKHDAETLVVEPLSGDLYVITKVYLGLPTVYKATAPLVGNGPRVLQRIADLRVPSLMGGAITGGDVSSDGRRVALCDYFAGYELVLPPGSSNFNEIWKQQMITIDLGKRKQGEGIAYRLDGRALLTTSEGKSSPVTEVVRRKQNDK